MKVFRFEKRRGSGEDLGFARIHVRSEEVETLPALPGNGYPQRPVTLDFDRRVCLRARDEATGTVREVALARSQAGSDPVCIAVDRVFLARMLDLGCLTLRVSPNAAVLSAESANHPISCVPSGPP